jgi:hypothetical protein
MAIGILVLETVLSADEFDYDLSFLIDLLEL